MSGMRTWTCRSMKAGRYCLHKNLAVKKKCEKCGTLKPARRLPKHLAALSFDYEHYVRLTGGDYCAICLRPRASDGDRRLNRDHDHRTGQPRGLLCPRCNRALPAWITPEWLDAAADYLRKAA